MYLDDLLDRDLLAKMLAEGYVRAQTHPTLPYVIYNYAEKAVFEKQWNEVTLQCRGLIVEQSSGLVLARPFPKFFNYGEWKPEDLPTGPCEVFEKVDGSLGILYPTPDGWAIATRGSFNSEQALVATEILRNKYSDYAFCGGCTYLFEILYPQNRIVVDYGDLEDLVLLDVLDRHDGTSSMGWCDDGWPGPRAEKHPYNSLTEVLAAPQVTNAEGFVVRFENGERIKVKFEEYVKAHAVVTNTSSVTVWKYLTAGAPLESLFEFVPDEFRTWVEDTAAALDFKHDQICDYVNDEFEEVVLRLNDEHAEYWTRKEFAALVANNPYRAELFLRLDGRNFDDLVWRRVKPERELPFRTKESV